MTRARLIVSGLPVAVGVMAALGGCGAGSQSIGTPSRVDGGDAGGSGPTDGSAYNPDSNVMDAGCLGPVMSPDAGFQCDGGSALYLCTYNAAPSRTGCTASYATSDGDVEPQVYCCAP